MEPQKNIFSIVVFFLTEIFFANLKLFRNFNRCWSSLTNDTTHIYMYNAYTHVTQNYAIKIKRETHSALIKTSDRVALV